MERELTQELLQNPLSFEQTYDRVKQVQPRDPLEKYGLGMMDFDQLLDKHQGDSQVRESISKIMGAPNPGATQSEGVQAITVRQIIDVHQFMLEQIEEVTKHFHSLPDKDKYDVKTVTIVTQALVGSKIEAKFKITSEDIESAVMMHHTFFATDQEFAQLNIKIQHAMGKLMGTPFQN